MWCPLSLSFVRQSREYERRKKSMREVPAVSDVSVPCVARSTLVSRAVRADGERCGGLWATGSEQATQKLCIMLMDQALERMAVAGGDCETVLCVFDLRGFGYARHSGSLSFRKLPHILARFVL